MKNITILILPFLFSCTTKTEPTKPFTEAPVAVCPTVDSAHTPQLLWSTAGFDAPESIFYYDDGPSSAPVYFVSNVVGSPVGKDGKGWISTVSIEGKILKKKFAEGLNAPKGLYAREGNLWVSDIDRVVSFSTNDGKERNIIKVSDWMDGKVFRLKKNGECVTLLENLEGAADIMFVEKTRILLVPVMAQDLVKSYAIPKF